MSPADIDHLLAQVTVLVVTYNSRHCLPALARGLATLPHVTVVDNASQDGTPDAVRASLPQARLIVMPANQGYGVANTAGLAQVVAMGYRIAGFSLNGDAGASLDAAETARRIASARDGEVIIAHVNQPKRTAGAGVAAGVRALRARGLRFVRLSAPGVEVIPA